MPCRPAAQAAQAAQACGRLRPLGVRRCFWGVCPTSGPPNDAFPTMHLCCQAERPNHTKGVGVPTGDRPPDPRSERRTEKILLEDGDGGIIRPRFRSARDEVLAVSGYGRAYANGKAGSQAEDGKKRTWEEKRGREFQNRIIQLKPQAPWTGRVRCRSRATEGRVRGLEEGRRRDPGTGRRVDQRRDDEV